jgi:hypothetical protein
MVFHQKPLKGFPENLYGFFTLCEKPLGFLKTPLGV